MFLMAAATAGSLPTWYLANRVHAHTRLRIKDYCHNGTGARSDSKAPRSSSATASALQEAVEWLHSRCGRWPSARVASIASESVSV